MQKAVDPEIIKEFKKLVDAKEGEQKYQDFLEKHTEFIPRQFVQHHGIHHQLVLRKLSLGSEYKTDFFYLSKSSVQWNCVLIEIEKPHSRFFKDESNDFHADFSNALHQMNQWRAWLMVDANKTYFLHHTIGSLMEGALSNNPCEFKFVLVHGRRGEFVNNSTRRRLIHGTERPDFKVMSYDALLDSPQMDSLYVGVKKNETLEILSTRFVGEGIFQEPLLSILRIKRGLYDDAMRCRDEWHTYHFDDLNKPIMETALPKAIIID